VSVGCGVGVSVGCGVGVSVGCGVGELHGFGPAGGPPSSCAARLRFCGASPGDGTGATGPLRATYGNGVGVVAGTGGTCGASGTRATDCVEVLPGGHPVG
jgi:hypothetical protein